VGAACIAGAIPFIALSPPIASALPLLPNIVSDPALWQVRLMVHHTGGRSSPACHSVAGWHDTASVRDHQDLQKDAQCRFLWLSCKGWKAGHRRVAPAHARSDRRLHTEQPSARFWAACTGAPRSATPQARAPPQHSHFGPAPLTVGSELIDAAASHSEPGHTHAYADYMPSSTREGSASARRRGTPHPTSSKPHFGAKARVERGIL